MKLSLRSNRKTTLLGKKIIATFLLAIMLGQIAPIQAETISEQTQKLWDFSIKPTFSREPALRKTPKPLGMQALDTSQRTSQVAYIRLCPRSLKLYPGEQYHLVPVGLDSTSNVVHSVDVSWQSSNSSVVTIDNTGEVSAVSSGTANLTAQIGSASATVSVLVNTGVR